MTLGYAAPHSAVVGAPPRGGSLLDELERVLAKRQELVLRLETLAGERGEVADRERASIRYHIAGHASAIDRLFAELGAVEPPDGPPLA